MEKDIMKLLGLCEILLSAYEDLILSALEEEDREQFYFMSGVRLQLIITIKDLKSILTKLGFGLSDFESRINIQDNDIKKYINDLENFLGTDDELEIKEVDF